MFWSHPNPCANTIGRLPRPAVRTLLRVTTDILTILAGLPQRTKVE
jgi:hypothetical protein